MAQRTYIALSEPTMQRLDAIAEKYGVTRSALISMVLGQYCESTERMFNALPSALSGALNTAINPASVPKA